MKQIAPFALVLLAGCGSQTRPLPVVTRDDTAAIQACMDASASRGVPCMLGSEPNISHPVKSLSSTPYVEFMGDRQIMEVVAFAGNPLWKCSTCVQDQTSADVLGEVPDVIGRHPDLVVIQCCAADLIESPSTHDVGMLFSDVQQAVDALEAAKIPAVVAMLPGSDSYDDYYFNEAVDLENQAGIIPNVFTANDTNTDLTAGIDYTQTGLMTVEPLFYSDVESFQVGGVK